MPELPEVETVRRQLAGSVVGSSFVRVARVERAMLQECTTDQLRTGLPGRRIRSVDRLGKFLVAALEYDAYLTLHLGMTGQLLVDGVEASAHTRFLFWLTNGNGRPQRLEFRDMRKFGRLHMTAGAPAARLEDLGPDAWRGAWNTDYLARRMWGRKGALKAFLLDQRHLAGIGNIYADEILWWSGLSPVRRCGSLTTEEVARLGEEIPRVLGEGVRLLGCSVADFVDTAGRPGSFQEWLRAYGRQGQQCFRCGKTLVRVVIASRGTAYCPGCQH